MMSVMPLRTSICACVIFVAFGISFSRDRRFVSRKLKDYGLWSIFRVMKVDEKKEKLHSTG